MLLFYQKAWTLEGFTGSSLFLFSSASLSVPKALTIWKAKHKYSLLSFDVSISRESHDRPMCSSRICFFPTFLIALVFLKVLEPEGKRQPSKLPWAVLFSLRRDKIAFYLKVKFMEEWEIRLFQQWLLKQIFFSLTSQAWKDMLY